MMTTMTNKRLCHIIISAVGMILFVIPSASAQTDTLSGNKIIDKCHLFGIGSTNVLDTYLSPEDYTGLELRALSESSRLTNLIHGKISYMSMSMGNISFLDYRNGNGSEIAGLYSYDIGWHYNWMLCDGRLRLQAGSLLDFNIGFIYNTRNSNNPAQAKLYLNLAPSFIATYRLRLWDHPFSLRYMLNIPVVGVMFSPNYGQSYYEIFSEGNYDHNAVATFPGNAPSLRQMLTLDFNIGKNTYRVGYMNDIQQSRVNNLKSHVWSHLFMIGFVKRFKLIPVQQ
jgi:hypothetical protein